MNDDPVTNAGTNSSVVASRDPSYGISQFWETWHQLAKASITAPNAKCLHWRQLYPTILMSNFCPLTLKGTTAWSSFSAIFPMSKQVVESQSRRTSVTEEPVMETRDLNVGKHKSGSWWTQTICPGNKSYKTLCLIHDPNNLEWLSQIKYHA